MRTSLHSAGLVALLSLAASASAATHPVDLEARLAAQDTLFEEWYQSDLRAHPERATAYGDYRYNDQLDRRSLAAWRAEHASDQAYLKRLSAISTTGFSEQDVTSHQVLLRALRQRVADYDFREFEMPVSQLNGPHVDLADLPIAVPFESVKQYEDYIARLHQIPRAFADTEEVLRAGMRHKLMPVRFLLEKVPAQCEGVIKVDPFLLPTRQFPAGISLQDQQRLTKAITEAVTEEVLPAYQAFGDFIRTEYAPHGRATLSVTSLPGGEARYLNDIRSRTSVSSLTPDQLHELGLREIDRIRAEMLVVARHEGFADVAAYREALEADPRYRPASAEQILDDFRRYLGQMQRKLPELFARVPHTPVTVEPMPEFQAAMATHYVTGTPDRRRAGRVVVATSHFADRSMVNDEATAYHEGVPGHHLQLSLAQEITGLPKFREHARNSGYTEGWALYAEELGKEVGLFQDPGSDFGRLSNELWRAVRLVVDTGIHSKGWSRERVVEFMRKSGAVDEPTVQSETDRYIAWPAQALAYKLGQLKFRELRERAKAQLGTRFDIRSFHDEVLSGGVLPLDLLEARTEGWIRAQRLSADSAVVR